MIKVDVRRNTYYDSVTLMLISKEIKNIDGVQEVLVGMGTELNLELSENLGLKDDSIGAISANDFFIAADVSSEAVMKTVVEQVDALLSQKKTESGSDYKPVSLAGALDLIPDANLAIVSIPGAYAEEEVNKLLDEDLHVMLFSDNVSVESELKLKQKAVEKGLLMMGPDCGTAIINGIPLAFANKVKKGPIGIVGASGTGTQEVSSLIGTFGSGVSQVIGTGGRDLKSEIGGLMMIQGMQALMSDDETKVIVLISKPPAPEVAKKILEMVKDTNKPVVVDFIGGDQQMIKDAGAHSCTTLEDAALKAVALAERKDVVESEGFTIPKDQLDKWLTEASNALKSDQVNLRGLYTGGTLADEAMKMLGNSLGGIYSNIPLSPEYELKDLNAIEGHVCLDLGEDQFTVGRPHPMIDPSTRSDRFETDLDGTVAVCLIDVVIGYGSHEDPAGEVAKSIADVKSKLSKNAQTLVLQSLLESTPASEVESLLTNLNPGKREWFKKELWRAYIQDCPEVDSFLTIWEDNRAEIKKLEDQAATEAPQWLEAIDLFNSRFIDMPFRLGLFNQAEAVLGKSKAQLKFVFEDGEDVRECKRAEITALSQGEKRALYLLNFIFDVEILKKSDSKTFFIIDDVADSFDYKNKHAILQYLHDLTAHENFYQIILTHNFDFYRSLTQFVNRKGCLMANQANDRIALEVAEGVNNIFVKVWKKDINRSESILYSCVPFTRNIIEYTKGDQHTDYETLTKLLHWKEGTEDITEGQFYDIYNSVFETDHDSTGSDKMIDILFRTADKVSEQDSFDGLNLQDKVLLSVAIRIKAERYITNRLREIEGESYWSKKKAYGRLLGEFEPKFPSDQALPLLKQVSVTVCSNIHLNSFMYEPILDLSIEHLIHLYKGISDLT